eukprot:gene21709-33414_t
MAPSTNGRRIPLPAPKALELWRLAWPAMLRQLVSCSCDRLTLAAVGHWDPSVTHYDGAGLGKMFSNITGLSIGLGLNMGLATLSSQAHGKGRAAQLNGIYLRQCFLILACAFVFTAVTTVFAEKILLSFGQPADVAKASADYALVQLAGVPLFWLTAALQTVCDGLQRTQYGFWSTVLSASVQVILTVVF